MRFLITFILEFVHEAATDLLRLGKGPYLQLLPVGGSRTILLYLVYVYI